jgi:hypothetical protein
MKKQTKKSEQIALGKVADDATFKISKKSKVTYTKIREERDGIVFTSNNSPKSFKQTNRFLVYPI